MALTSTESAGYAIARSGRQGYPSGVSKLGKNIERLRLAAGHTNAAQFARSIGITPPTLNDWESGRYSNLRLDSLLRVARGVPCSIEELLEGVDPDYEKVRTVADVKRRNIDEPMTLLVPSPGVSSDLRAPNTDAPRGTQNAQPPPVRSPLKLAEELRAHAAALIAIAVELAREAARGARARPSESSPRHTGTHGLHSGTTSRRGRR